VEGTEEEDPIRVLREELLDFWTAAPAGFIIRVDMMWTND